MAPSIREVVSNSLLYTAASKVNTVQTSANVQAGDTLVMVYGLDYGQLDQSQGPTPGGWLSQCVATSAGVAPYARIWTSPVTKAGVQTVSVTQTDQYTDSNLILLVIAGPVASTPVDVTSINNGSHATQHVAASLTTSYPDELVIWGFGSGIVANDVGSYAMPAGVTLQRQTTSPSYSTLAVGTEVRPTAGATGTRTATFTRSQSPTTAVKFAAVGIALRGPAPTPTDGVSSALGVTNQVTTSKSVTSQVASTTSVTDSPGPSKQASAQVASQVSATALMGERPDVISIPPGGPLDISIWALDLAENYAAPLPDYTKITISPKVNDPGTITIDYPENGLNWHLLHDIVLGNRDLEIAVQLGGRDAGSLRALILEAQGDEVAENAVWTFVGAFLEYRMSEAVVYPDPTDPSGQQQAVFINATAGQIMASLMKAAQARGALTDIDYSSFTAVTDSAGIKFSTTATLAIAPGIDYASLLGTLTDIGLCEWQVTRNHALRLFEPGTRGTDRTVLTPPLVLRQARDLVTAPRKYSVRDSATTVVGIGSGGLNATASDPTALARRGRRVEKYASQNQLTDQGALQAFVQATLGGEAHGKMEIAHALSFAPGGPLPVADFKLGDWVFSDNGNGLERLRVQQWSITQDQNGTKAGEVTLGSLIDEHDLQVARRLAAITSGTAVVGTSTTVSSPTNQGKTPAVPLGLVCSSLTYVDPGPPALDAAAIYCGWAPVTLNTDGTPISGGQVSYRVRYRYLDDTSNTAGPLPEGWVGTPSDGLPWIAAGSTTTTTLQFSGLSPNRPIEVEVAASIALDPTTQPYEYDSLNRAFRRTCLQSPWSGPVDLTTAADTTPPLAPSAPTVSTGPGNIARIIWDGTSVDGLSLATECPDVARIEVHLSAVSNFTPDPTPGTGTLRDTLYGPSGTVISDGLLYQVGYFVRLVAIDQAGNRSAPSVQTAFTCHELLTQDLFAGCVGTTQLGLAVIKSANIDVAQINDAHVANMSVGKLTSGVGTFDLLLAGRIRTALAGARIEMDSVSFRQYGLDGTTLMTQFTAATGEALITGLIRSALTAKRWEMNPDGTLRLFGPSGTGYSAIFNNSPDGVTNEIVLRGQLDSNTPGRSGYLRVNSTGIAAQFGVPGQTVTAQLTVQTANIDITSPINGMRSDQRYPTATGNPYNNLLIFNDANGADIAAACFQHSYQSSYTTWGNTGRNLNIRFDNTTYSTHRFALVYNNGNYADIQCGNVYAPNVTAPSGRSFKTRVSERLGFDPITLIRRAPAMEWEYRHDAFEGHSGGPSEDHQRPWMLRRRKEGTDRMTGHHHDFEWVEHERPDTPHALSYTGVRRIGPMADDIHRHAPQMVSRDHTGQLHLSMFDQIGVLWAAVGRLVAANDALTERVNQLTTHAALPRARALPQLPGGSDEA